MVRSQIMPNKTNVRKTKNMNRLSGMTILVTGGAGYIGSHACVELLNSGCNIIVIDNLSNSSATALERVSKITNKSLSVQSSIAADIIFYEADIRNKNVLQDIFINHKVDAVMHFSGLKAVGESVSQPLEYYSNNVLGSIILFQQMEKAGVKTIVFSSSATVYGAPKTMPITEEFITGETTNPYGQSKYIVEQILKDIGKSDSSWKICSLRYFNPIGAHPSGMIGEDPTGTPNNLIPYIAQVAAGRLDRLKIFGNTYPTVDGTGVRDYIHVVDLAKGHISALNYLTLNTSRSFSAFNLGTGEGKSVFEILNAFEKASGKLVPFEVVDERNGDIAECWASTQHVESVLGWKAHYDVSKMCEDAWNWQSRNPKGYEV